MIRFNALLREEKIDPAHVRLVRHQDVRANPYRLWLAQNGEMELYQRIQRKLEFRDSKMLASFVATPLDETLFVGMYQVEGVGIAPSGTFEPTTRQDVEGYHLYDLTLHPALSDLRGRLVVDWGKGYRKWVQLAGKQNKKVIELHRLANEPPFPGFLHFRESFQGLATVPTSWRSRLSEIAGIYVLIHPETGKQYVGSAQGIGGFWGRWEQYVASGHGNNRRMLELAAADYQVSILEVAASSADPSVLADMESKSLLK